MNPRIRSLAKIFGPVLLTTTLVLPAQLAAPSNAFAAVQMERGEKNERNKRQNQNQARGQARQQRAQAQQQRDQARQQREQARQNRGQQRRQQVQAQAQQRREAQRVQQQQQRNQLKLQQRQAQAQRQAQQRQAQIQRQAQQRQAQIQRQQYQRQVQVQRQAQIQRQAELKRQAELRRQAQIRRDNNRNYYPRDRQAYYDNRYNNNRYYRDYQRNGGRHRYDGRYYGPNDRFHIDGFVVDEGSGCSLFKDHQTGEMFALVGNIGDIQQGDHMRLQGRVVDGGVCDWRGTGFEVIQVKTLWDSNRHEHASYDFQRDRITFEQYLDRHDYRDDRYGYGDWR